MKVELCFSPNALGPDQRFAVRQSPPPLLNLVPMWPPVADLWDPLPSSDKARYARGGVRCCIAVDLATDCSRRNRATCVLL